MERTDVMNSFPMATAPRRHAAPLSVPVIVFVPDPAYPTSACADDAPPATELQTPPPINFISENVTSHSEAKAFAFLCRMCGLTMTTQTRTGPDGPATLCNKCASPLQCLTLTHAHLRCGLARAREERRKQAMHRRMSFNALCTTNSPAPTDATLPSPPPRGLTWQNPYTAKRTQPNAEESSPRKR